MTSENFCDEKKVLICTFQDKKANIVKVCYEIQYYLINIYADSTFSYFTLSLQVFTIEHSFTFHPPYTSHSNLRFIQFNLYLFDFTYLKICDKVWRDWITGVERNGISANLGDLDFILTHSHLGMSSEDGNVKRDFNLWIRFYNTFVRVATKLV